MTPRCALCNRELLESGERIYQKYEGWARPGKGIGGQSGSSLVLRQPMDEYAHSTCIQKLRAGVTANQPPLFDE